MVTVLTDAGVNGTARIRPSTIAQCHLTVKPTQHGDAIEQGPREIARSRHRSGASVPRLFASV